MTDRPDWTPAALSTFGEVRLDAMWRDWELCDSYSRLPMLIGQLYHKIEHEAWLRLLGDNWTVCDNIGSHRRLLAQILPKVGPVRQMMDTAELAAWDALPDPVTIYRGARVHHLGASWALDPAVARRFPFYLRYRFGENPTLITAEVRKRDVLAVKLDRGEFEAIVFRGRRVVSREELPESDLVSDAAAPTGAVLGKGLNAG